MQYIPLPEGIVEMPAMDDNSIMESPPPEVVLGDARDQAATTFGAAILDHSLQFSPPETPLNHFVDEYDSDAGRVVHTDDEAPQPRYESKPFIHLPSVDGRGERFQDDEEPRLSAQGGLRIANRSSLDDDDWRQPAVMHSNLAGNTDHGRYGR